MAVALGALLGCTGTAVFMCRVQERADAQTRESLRDLASQMHKLQFDVTTEQRRWATATMAAFEAAKPEHGSACPEVRACECEQAAYVEVEPVPAPDSVTLAASQRATDILQSALRAGAWTDADQEQWNLTLIRLPKPQLEQAMAQLTDAINNERFQYDVSVR